MKEILQFEPGDLNAILRQYVAGTLSTRAVCEELNSKLRDKAEASREMEEQPRRFPRPNCF